MCDIKLITKNIKNISITTLINFTITKHFLGGLLYRVIFSVVQFANKHKAYITLITTAQKQFTKVSLSCVSVAQLCPTLCGPVDCSTLDFPVFHYLLEFAQTCVYWVSDVIQPSHPLYPWFSSCPQTFPASGSFPMNQLSGSASGGQSIGASASASVLLMNIQDWLL